MHIHHCLQSYQKNFATELFILSPKLAIIILLQYFLIHQLNMSLFHYTPNNKSHLIFHCFIKKCRSLCWEPFVRIIYWVIYFFVKWLIHWLWIFYTKKIILFVAYEIQISQYIHKFLYILNHIWKIWCRIRTSNIKIRNRIISVSKSDFIFLFDDTVHTQWSIHSRQ